MQCGVAAPAEALIGRESAGALSFEEEDALAEGVVVVVTCGGDGAEQEEEHGEEAKCGKREESIWRHVFGFFPLYPYAVRAESVSDEGGKQRGSYINEKAPLDSNEFSN